MLLILEMLLRVVVYSFILFVVRMVIYKLQSSNNEEVKNKKEECRCNMKQYSAMFFVLAIFGAIILAFILSCIPMRNHEKVYTVATCLVFIVTAIVLSSLCGRVYLKLEEESIKWRTMFGKHIEKRYNDIDFFLLELNGDLHLYQNEKCILSFATGSHKDSIREKLFEHGLKPKKVKNKLILKLSMFYFVIFMIFILISLVFLVVFLIYEIYLGAIFMMIGSTLLISSFIPLIKHTIIIDDNTIYSKSIFKNKQIKFGEISHLEYKQNGDAYQIIIYSKDGIKIKLHNTYTNIDEFIDLAKTKHWKWK